MPGGCGPPAADGAAVSGSCMCMGFPCPPDEVDDPNDDDADDDACVGSGMGMDMDMGGSGMGTESGVAPGMPGGGAKFDV